MKLPKILIPLALLLTSAPALAAGGVTFALEYGAGSWSFDKDRIARQLPLGYGSYAASAMVDNVQTAQEARLRLGYDILGWASLEGFIGGTGWNLTTVDRGGGGFGGGTLSFHPAQIWFPERKWDVELFAGYGYGIVGQVKGMDGGAFLWGLRGEYKLGKLMIVGADFTMHNLLFNAFYEDYDRRNLPGAMYSLPEGSGGTFFTGAVFLGFKIDPMND